LWSYFTDDSDCVGPQPPLVGFSKLLAGGAGWLAWWTANDAIGSPLWAWGDSSHVVVPADLGPMFCEHSTTELADFNLPFTTHPRSFKAKVKATDTGEQRTKGKLLHSAALASSHTPRVFSN
jgi:hypothetical protein